MAARARAAAPVRRDQEAEIRDRLVIAEAKVEQRFEELVNLKRTFATAFTKKTGEVRNAQNNLQELRMRQLKLQNQIALQGLKDTHRAKVAALVTLLNDNEVVIPAELRNDPEEVPAGPPPMARVPPRRRAGARGAVDGDEDDVGEPEG